MREAAFVYYKTKQGHLVFSMVLFCCSAVLHLTAVLVKGRVAGVEILAVQMLLRPTEGVTDLPISNKRRLRLVV